MPLCRFALPRLGWTSLAHQKEDTVSDTVTLSGSEEGSDYDELDITGDDEANITVAPRKPRKEIIPPRKPETFPPLDFGPPPYGAKKVSASGRMIEYVVVEIDVPRECCIRCTRWRQMITDGGDVLDPMITWRFTKCGNDSQTKDRLRRMFGRRSGHWQGTQPADKSVKVIGPFPSGRFVKGVVKLRAGSPFELRGLDSGAEVRSGDLTFGSEQAVFRDAEGNVIPLRLDGRLIVAEPVVVWQGETPSGAVRVEKDVETGVVVQKLNGIPVVRITPNVDFHVLFHAEIDTMNRSARILDEGGRPISVSIEIKDEAARLVIESGAGQAVAVDLRTGNVIH